MLPDPRRSGAALLPSLLLLACGGGEDGGGERAPRRGVALEEAFRLDERIVLEESPNDPLGEVTGLTIGPEGGLLVVDGPASRIRGYGPGGERLWALGSPGEGPGELQGPTAAAVGPDGRLYVVQRGGPRVTVFRRGEPGDSASTFRIPGHTGHWAARVGDRLALGIGTREERFATVTPGGEVVASFASRRPSPDRFPAGMFVMADHAAVAGDRILVNTSFSPRVRVHGVDGDSLRSFGEPPASWIPPSPPAESGATADADQEMADWLASFTVVTGLATVGDSVGVVQYGRHDPAPEQPYRVVHRTVDVYRLDGTKLYEDLPLEEPILAGGDRLYTLGGEPPGPWIIDAHRPTDGLRGLASRAGPR